MNRAFKFIGLICLFAAALILSAMLAIAEEFDGALAVTQQPPSVFEAGCWAYGRGCGGRAKPKRSDDLSHARLFRPCDWGG